MSRGSVPLVLVVGAARRCRLSPAQTSCIFTDLFFERKRLTGAPSAGASPRSSTTTRLPSGRWRRQMLQNLFFLSFASFCFLLLFSTSPSRLSFASYHINNQQHPGIDAAVSWRGWVGSVHGEGWERTSGCCHLARSLHCPSRPAHHPHIAHTLPTHFPYFAHTFSTPLPTHFPYFAHSLPTYMPAHYQCKPRCNRSGCSQLSFFFISATIQLRTKEGSKSATIFLSTLGYHALMFLRYNIGTVTPFWNLDLNSRQYYFFGDFSGVLNIGSSWL